MTHLTLDRRQRAHAIELRILGVDAVVRELEEGVGLSIVLEITATVERFFDEDKVTVNFLLD